MFGVEGLGLRGGEGFVRARPGLHWPAAGSGGTAGHRAEAYGVKVSVSTPCTQRPHGPQRLFRP